MPRLPSDVIYLIASHLWLHEWLLLAEALPEDSREISYPHHIQVSRCTNVLRQWYEEALEDVPFPAEAANLRWQNMYLPLPSDDLSKLHAVLAASERCLKKLRVTSCFMSASHQCHDLLAGRSDFRNVEKLDLRCNHNNPCAFFEHHFPMLRSLDISWGSLNDPSQQKAIEHFIGRHTRLSKLTAVHPLLVGVLFHPVSDNIISIRFVLHTIDFEMQPFADALTRCTRNRRATVRAKCLCQGFPAGKFGNRWRWTRAAYGSPTGPGNECRAVFSPRRVGPARSGAVEELFRLEAAGICLLPLLVCQAAFARYQYITFELNHLTILELARNRPDLRFEIVVFGFRQMCELAVEDPAPVNAKVRILLRHSDGLVSVFGPSGRLPDGVPLKRLLRQFRKAKDPHLPLLHQLLEALPGELPKLHSQNVAICGIVDPLAPEDNPFPSCGMAELESLPLRQRCWDLPDCLVGFRLSVSQSRPETFAEDLSFFREY